MHERKKREGGGERVEEGIRRRRRRREKEEEEEEGEKQEKKEGEGEEVDEDGEVEEEEEEEEEKRERRRGRRGGRVGSQIAIGAQGSRFLERIRSDLKRPKYRHRACLCVSGFFLSNFS